MKASQTMQVEYMVNPMYLGHGEPDVPAQAGEFLGNLGIYKKVLLRLIEVLGYFPGLDSLDGAEEDQQHVVHLEQGNGVSTIQTAMNVEGTAKDFFSSPVH